MYIEGGEEKKKKQGPKQIGETVCGPTKVNLKITVFLGMIGKRK